jgi:hypothetical protein
LASLLGPVLAAASTMAARPTASMVALFCSGWVDFQRTACRTEGRGAVDRAMEMAGRMVELKHGLALHSCLESRGAAVRRCGNAWNKDAMPAGVGEEQCLCLFLMLESMTFPSAVVRWRQR